MSLKHPTVVASAAGLAIGAAAGQAIARKVARSDSADVGAVPAEPATTKPSADDLDKELLDQLHAATLKASDSCFEIKKLCATVLIPTGTLVALFSNRRLGPAVFISGFLVIAFFWLADSVGYYYQRKLRAAMGAIWIRRSERCDETWIPPDTQAASPLRSAFNGSMYFYLLLTTPVAVGLVLYIAGAITSPHEVSP